MDSLLNALEYLHGNFIVHRDLKPENILFGTDGTPKIADFGLAHYEYGSPDISSSDLMIMKTCCGTPLYVAPEIILNKGYNSKCDMWSLGVILFIMLVGYQPFAADTLPEIYKVILKGKANFKSKRWSTVSKEGKNLVRCLLKTDPSKRFSVNDVRSHPWFIKHIHS